MSWYALSIAGSGSSHNKTPSNGPWLASCVQPWTGSGGAHGGRVPHLYVARHWGLLAVVASEVSFFPAQEAWELVPFVAEFGWDRI